MDSTKNIILQRIYSQHCLLAMLENFNKSMDNRNEFEALITDLTKAIDCIDHKLLIARLFLYEIHLQLLIQFTQVY